MLSSTPELPASVSTGDKILFSINPNGIEHLDREGGQTIGKITVKYRSDYGDGRIEEYPVVTTSTFVEGENERYITAIARGKYGGTSIANMSSEPGAGPSPEVADETKLGMMVATADGAYIIDKIVSVQLNW